ncbi:hypothetical protein Avbf_11270 [Armadillidium vulgare]|nr:hypothetical protein Avbf_11270 [Armadillidium vulgare]
MHYQFLIYEQCIGINKIANLMYLKNFGHNMTTFESFDLLNVIECKQGAVRAVRFNGKCDFYHHILLSHTSLLGFKQ